MTTARDIRKAAVNVALSINQALVSRVDQNRVELPIVAGDTVYIQRRDALKFEKVTVLEVLPKYQNPRGSQQESEGAFGAGNRDQYRIQDEVVDPLYIFHEEAFEATMNVYDSVARRVLADARIPVVEEPKRIFKDGETGIAQLIYAAAGIEY